MTKKINYIITGAIIFAVITGLLGFQATMFSQHEDRIVALGDSLTYGRGDESGHGYVEDLEQWLDHHHEKEVTVDNYGIPDQQSDGLLSQMHELTVLKSIEKADYILLFIGTNDVIESNGGNLTEINKERIVQGKQDYKKNLTKILDTIREKNAEAPILFLGLYNPFPDADKINEVILDWNETSLEIIQSYNNVTYVKTNDLFEEKTTRYFSDALHLNKEGYERLTKRIIKEYKF